jgi:hypothetical protein
MQILPQQQLFDSLEGEFSALLYVHFYSALHDTSLRLGFANLAIALDIYEYIFIYLYIYIYIYI